MERSGSGNKPSICAVLLAAGASTRMGENKLLMRFFGKTPIELCLSAFAPFADEFVVVVSESTREAALEAIENAGICVPVKLVGGGSRRQDSVFNALTAARADIVSVHDCARCCVSEQVIKSSLETAVEYGCGIASSKVVDTLRLAETGELVDRDQLLAAQTPQSFIRSRLLDAYNRIDPKDTYTDDAAVYRAGGNALRFSLGSSSNIKLTGRDDIAVVTAILGKNTMNESKIQPNSAPPYRIGFGEDTHRLKEGRKLILGGVEIPFEYGLDGHSDADALTHALIDAVLGACALGDIGMHFPDSDMRYKGINSLLLASHAAALVREHGFEIENLDSTVIAQRPKLAAFRESMREKLAEAFGVDVSRVSVKFTTPEHTGPEGRGESMTVRAAALVY